jgi:hypothetical protein
MKKTAKHIEVKETIIHITQHKKEDYISLTDMLKYKESGGLIFKWLSNKNTIEFLGVWEKIYNPDFNYTEFGVIMQEAGVNRFTMSVKQWIEKTNAIGIIAKTGRYGGTYAHKDIAFELGTWISPEFKLLVIREFQRLKEIENNQYNLEWNVKRILSKANYHIHTDAIKNFILPTKDYDKDKEWIIYAEEADLLNVALFKCTAKDWRDANLKHADAGMNIRDIASINELAVLSNLETLNAEMITNGVNKTIRYNRLKEISEYQLSILNEKDFMKTLKKMNDKIYIEKTKE